jgi:hypothetical protein
LTSGYGGKRRVPISGNGLPMTRQNGRTSRCDTKGNLERAPIWSGRVLEQKSWETTVILMYAAHGELHTSALVLKQIIEKNLKTRSSLGKKGVSDISGYFCPPEGVFVTLGSFCTLCTEKRLYYPCLFLPRDMFCRYRSVQNRYTGNFYHSRSKTTHACSTHRYCGSGIPGARIAVLCHDI